MNVLSRLDVLSPLGVGGVMHGCNLEWLSDSSYRVRVGAVNISGQRREIISDIDRAGISPTADQILYIYAAWSGTAVTISETSRASAADDPGQEVSTGVWTKPGDTGRTLIAALWANSSGVLSRFVMSRTGRYADVMILDSEVDDSLDIVNASDTSAWGSTLTFSTDGYFPANLVGWYCGFLLTSTATPSGAAISDVDLASGTPFFAGTLYARLHADGVATYLLPSSYIAGSSSSYHYHTASATLKVRIKGWRMSV